MKESPRAVPLAPALCRLRFRSDAWTPWLLAAAWALGGLQQLQAAGLPQPAPGLTRVAKPAKAIAEQQAGLCARICAELRGTPLQTAEFKDPQISTVLRYRLFRPSPLGPKQTYPLVLCLHGGGADNRFDDLLNCASPFFAFGPARFLCAAEQSRHPAFVLVPWSGGRGWQEENRRLVTALVRDLSRNLPIDPRRIYVTGQSMGGYATWRLLEENPELFAAGIPVCGGGEPALAARLKSLSIWAFHGTADTIVPVAETRRLITAVREAGGKPAYWEYQDEDHAGTARRAYCELGLTDWLFAQAKH